MTKVMFADNRKKTEEAGLLGKGDYLKLQEGANKVRLMSECLPHPGEYLGKQTFKWLCYGLDRKDGTIKPFFMAHTIYKLIEALQGDSDYTFPEVPMPYDITINAKGAGTKEVEYSVLPARLPVPLTPAERALFTRTLPIGELQAKLREQQPVSADSQPEPQDDDGPQVGIDMPA